MKFIVYSHIGESAIRDNLGQPEYSYHFVLKGYQLALAELGSVELVQNPQTEVDPIFASCTARGEDCVFLSFAPPHKTSADLECPTVPVIAWEFSTIPNEALDDDPRSDWRFVLAKAGRAITLSSYTEQAIKGVMGSEFQVRSIAVPVVKRLAPAVKTARTAGADAELTIRGAILDSSTMSLSADLLAMPSRPPESRAAAPKAGAGELIRQHRSGVAVFSATGESLGVRWRCWIMSQVDRLREAGPAPLPDRSDAEAQATGQGRVKVGGVVYTSVLNPMDGRKNWADMVSAFCWAFRDTEDATLVLKMVHKDLAPYWGSLGLLLCRLSPFKCRVLTLHGYLEDEEYETLIEATTYYVNTSNCEGLCLPLMEFMVGGKPAIAPKHTAMMDYIDESVAFVVRSGLETNVWPQDPLHRFRTMRYRLDWESLLECFQQSYRIAKTGPEEYSAMAMRAKRRMQDYCSVATIKDQLRSFFEQSFDFNPVPTDKQRASAVAPACLGQEDK